MQDCRSISWIATQYSLFSDCRSTRLLLTWIWASSTIRLWDCRPSIIEHDSGTARAVFFQVRYLASRLLCNCSNISTVPKRVSLIGLRTRTHCFWTGIFHVSSWEESQDQCCQLSRIIWKTPDFGPYFPVSRLTKYKICQIITEFCHFFSRLDFPTNKISKILLCLSYFNVNIECFLNSGMPL